MSDGFDALVLDPIYEDPILAVESEYTPTGGSAATIRVIDKTQGVNVGPSVQQSTIKPVVHVRRADVADPPTNGTIKVPKSGGATYRIESWQRVLTGQGTATGELMLILVKA